MSRSVVVSLLAVYALFQLALPIGCHDALEQSASQRLPPHLHLSMLEHILRLGAVVGEIGAADCSEHDGDVIYFPSEASIVAAHERLEAPQDGSFAAIFSLAVVGAVLVQQPSLGRSTNATASAPAPRAATQRWQI